jgi:hypothetical protein
VPAGLGGGGQSNEANFKLLLPKFVTMDGSFISLEQLALELGLLLAPGTSAGGAMMGTTTAVLRLIADVSYHLTAQGDHQ